MGSTKEEQSRVRSLLLDTVSLLCKNGLTFKKQMKIQGLLGITLDEDDVFIVHINEAVGDAVADAAKRTGERSSSRESASNRTPDKNVARKRGATSSPASRGPPDKRQAGGEVIVIVEDDKRKLDKKPLITNVRGGLPPNHPLTPQKNPAMRNPAMGSPNRMPFVRVVGSPNQATLAQPSGHMSPFLGTPVGGPRPVIPGINAPRIRRPNVNEQKDFYCPVPKCEKSYYSMCALKLHIKLKHDDIEPEEFERLKSTSFRRKLVFTKEHTVKVEEKGARGTDDETLKNVARQCEDSGGTLDFESDFKSLDFSGENGNAFTSLKESNGKSDSNENGEANVNKDSTCLQNDGAEETIRDGQGEGISGLEGQCRRGFAGNSSRSSSATRDSPGASDSATEIEDT